ncbi:MAG: sugar transferase [Bacteroidia bacterium]|nr:sugar transferase [Bacteroidia bacterium]
MNKKIQVAKYVFSDLVAAGTAWTCFYLFRKYYIESEKFGVAVEPDFSLRFWLGLAIIPLFWLVFYAAAGHYKSIYRKSRLKELGGTLLVSLLGVILIFFVLILDDQIASYRSYYQSFIALFIMHFTLTLLFRLVLTTITVHRVHRREIGFPTLLVGSNLNALKLYQEMESAPKSSGNKFVGFVHVDEKNGYSHELKASIPHLGELTEIGSIIRKNHVEEVIIAIESSEHDSLWKIINEVDRPGVMIKVIPDMYDILSGSVKMSSIFGAALIEINLAIMPAWQQNLKRLFDILISAIFLTVFAPVYFFLALAVKLSSRGPVLYSHERIGLHGKPFFIHKFRSMYVDAEKNGPALSRKDDPRITTLGRFLRKSRMDELPQFWNVLRGEMSIVGPRPERQFFIDQILQKARHYKHLHKVRPGITSWGQVKYGYAENVDQMVERLKYDIIYLENMSFAVDLKIIIYTVLIVFQGRGK